MLKESLRLGSHREKTMKWWRIYSGIRYCQPRHIAYEDGGDGDAAAAATAVAAAATATAAATTEEERTAAATATTAAAALATAAAVSGGGAKPFDQEDVNRFLAEDRRKHSRKVVDLANEVKKLQDGGLSAEDKQKLEERIERMRQEHLTDEQKAKEKANALKNSHKEEVQTLTSEKDRWKGLYSKETIRTTILNASVTKENDAINPEQIVSILEPQAYLVEGLDESGAPDGSFIPKVKYLTVDEAEKEITLELTIPEVVKRMRETPNRFGNLFKTTAKGGLGGTSIPGGKGGKVDFTDAAAYRAYRKEHGTPQLGGTG